MSRLVFDPRGFVGNDYIGLYFGFRAKGFRYVGLGIGRYFIGLVRTA